MIFRRKAAAVAFSMAWQQQSCQRGQSAGENALAGLTAFRRALHGCMWRCPDALFELADAVLTAGPAPSLPYLSLEPVFRRGHGMVYQALAEGRIGEERLRDLLVAYRPPGSPRVFAIDASTDPPPWAATSPRREWHHHACPGSHRSDRAAVAGAAFPWLGHLRFSPHSPTPPPGPAGAGAAGAAT